MGKMATFVFCIFYHIFFKNRMKEKAKSLSHVQLFVTPWTVAYQAPPSMGYSRQEYWGGVPFPSPGDLPDPGIEPGSSPIVGRRFYRLSLRKYQTQV